jgi:hypothetical protein
MTLSRLSKAHPKGIPFYATVTNDDRKCHMSFSARMRCMRLVRMQGLAVEMAQLLSGHRGGFVGIRFNVNQRGRGVGGEGLDTPIDWEKRVITVGVAKWYTLKDEMKEAFFEDAKSVGGVHFDGEVDKGPFDVWDLDDHGRRINESGEVVPWNQADEFAFEDLEDIEEGLSETHTSRKRLGR